MEKRTDYKFVNKKNVTDIKTSDEMNWEDEKSFENYIAYNEKTPDAVIRILERSRKNKTRIRLFYGDESGCWHEQYDVLGRIGCSTGPIKIPLLIKTEVSLGGGAILDHCIMQITEDKKIVYKHEDFEMDVNYRKKEGEYPFEVYDNVTGKNIINVKTQSAAESMVSFFSGKANKYTTK